MTKKFYVPARDSRRHARAPPDLRKIRLRYAQVRRALRPIGDYVQSFSSGAPPDTATVAEARWRLSLVVDADTSWMQDASPPACRAVAGLLTIQESLEVPLLRDVPLDVRICADMDVEQALACIVDVVRDWADLFTEDVDVAMSAEFRGAVAQAVGAAKELDVRLLEEAVYATTNQTSVCISCM